jgi:hypothetical protein
MAKPKKKDDDAKTVERFEKALRRALSTPPRETRMRTRSKRGRKNTGR